MFNKIKEWWNRDKTIEVLRAQNDKLSAELAAALASLERVSAEVVTEQKRMERISKLKNSNTPWVDVRSADYDEELGIRIELDWNSAFVDQLREQGMKGKNDASIIQKWLAFMYEDIVQKLDAEAVEEAFVDQKGPGEFE